MSPFFNYNYQIYGSLKSRLFLACLIVSLPISEIVNIFIPKKKLNYFYKEECRGPDEETKEIATLDNDIRQSRTYTTYRLKIEGPKRENERRKRK